MPYQLRTFGGLGLRGSDGEPVEALLAHSKGMALLVYLVAQGPERGVARSELAALLWPEREEARARNALRSTLTRMRKAADPSPIEGKGQRHLRPASGRLEADVWDFRRALEQGDTERALELYRGEFLAGIRVADAAPFHRWVDQRRERLRDRAYEAALTTGRKAGEGGRLEAAETAYRRAFDLRPLREEGAKGLVRTLARRGRKAEALERFEAFRERRARELDLAPSVELRSLVEKIRDGEMEGTPSRPEAVDPGEPEVERRAATRPLESAAALWRDAGKLPAGALVLIAAVFGLWQLASSGSDRTAGGERSVAVLPFDAIGAEEPGPIARGLHSDLLTRLSSLSSLKVISATSVEPYGDTDLSLPAIADSLGVKWIVEGDVQQVGDAIQVHAQLVDPRTDTHAWAESYRRELTAGSLFEVQADISRRVAGVLTAQIDSGEEGRLTRRPTGDLEAYRFYVRGRGLLEQRKPSAIRRSLDYFDQAVAEDSAFALAWAGRADALAILARFPGFPPDTLLPRAWTAADRALALDPDLAEAHVASGRLHMFRRNTGAALRAFERAAALRPSYAVAHAWLAKLELSIGRPEEALDDAERSVELNPLSPENLGTLTIACHANGRVHRVLEISRRIRRLTGEPVGHELVALAHLSRLEQLRAQMTERGLSISEHPLFALYVTEAGGSAPVEEALTTAREQGDRRTAALLYAVLGDVDRALDILGRLYPRDEIPWDLDFTVFLRYDSYWPNTIGPLRRSPHYDALMREVNVRWGLEPDGSLPDSLDVSSGPRTEGRLPGSPPV